MKRALLVLGVLLLLLLVADRVAEGVAERAIADQVDAELTGSPAVEVGGFPFLTQALAGTFDEITVSDTGLDQLGVTVTGFRAELEGVEVAISDVLGGTVEQVPVRRATGTAVVGFVDLAGGSGSPVTLEPAGDQVRVRGSVELPGRTLDATALSDVSVEDDVLRVTATGFEVDGAAADDLAAVLGEALDLEVDLRGLPYGLRVERVRVTDDGVELTASARDVVLTR